MNVLIYGFGRMGLTHYSILRGLNPETQFTVIEPNKFLRLILKSNLNLEFLKDDTGLDKPFDLTLITTPPFIHKTLLNKSIERGDKKIFIEKPFGGYTNNKFNIDYKNTNIYIGYVLRFNPCIQWIKSKINYKDINSIRGEYLSNTIQKKPKGWRNGPYSGVVNEVGSHVIDLIQYIIQEDELNVINVKIENIYSDVDDIVEASLVSRNKIDISLYFNWVNKNIRKPIFNLQIQMNNGLEYYVDQQQIKCYNFEKKLIERISVTDIAETVPYYLRGIDFTKQMQDLVNQCKIVSSASEAISVNKTINNIIRYEDNFRR